MPEPGSRRRRRARIAALAVVAVLASGCTGSPHVAPGSLASAKERILGLVNATGAAIGAPARFSPAHVADLLPCNKTVLGYTVGHLSAHHAEVPVTIAIDGTHDGRDLLPRVERYWKAQGYTIDRSGLSDHRYPKLRTHVDGDLLVATGYVAVHQINIYGVTPCVRS